MYRQHYFKRFGMVHTKETFQHQNHELHRGEVVVHQHHLIHRWLLGAWARLYRQIGIAVRGGIIAGHGNSISAQALTFGLAFGGVLAGQYKRFRRQGKGRFTRRVKVAKNRTMICFDADDTLWHNERFFRLTQAHFTALLADFADPDHLSERLLAAEMRNLGKYGFGIKGFTLSMIECALEVTNDKVPGRVIREIVAAGQEMLRHPVELLAHAETTINTLAPDHKILLITKGDLLDQERKLAASGLGDVFDGVEIVSDKTPKTYIDAFAKHNIKPQNAMMVGNSLKSDVIPAIKAGGWGIYVPHGQTWALEHAPAPEQAPMYREIPSLASLADLVARVF